MYVHAGLPSGISGRPGQRRLESTGSGSDLIARRRLAPSTLASSFAGVDATLSTEPSTALGRYVARPFCPDFHAEW